MYPLQHRFNNPKLEWEEEENYQRNNFPPPSPLSLTLLLFYLLPQQQPPSLKKKLPHANQTRINSPITSLHQTLLLLQKAPQHRRRPFSNALQPRPRRLDRSRKAVQRGEDTKIRTGIIFCLVFSLPVFWLSVLIPKTLECRHTKPPP